jgi:tetratricopeptide (TPR) repeat protein
MTDKGEAHIDDPERVRLERLLHDAEGPDDRAEAYMFLGVLGERREEWNSAVGSYVKALAEGSQRNDVRYFDNNNLGYSLIQLGRLDEAEEYCLAAIELDAVRHNAHKNLGLVRQEQKRWLEAAFCFTEAYRLCPVDTRAWHLLSAVLNLQPELLKTSPDLRARIANLGLEKASHEN